MSINFAPYFSPIKVGAIELKHRIAMAPLTRLRNDDMLCPTDLSVEYYAQRYVVFPAIPTMFSFVYFQIPFSDFSYRGFPTVVFTISHKFCYLFLTTEQPRVAF